MKHLFQTAFLSILFVTIVTSNGFGLDLEIADLVAEPGDTVNLPVVIRTAGGDYISAANLTLFYGASVPFAPVLPVSSALFPDAGGKQMFKAHIVEGRLKFAGVRSSAYSIVDQDVLFSVDLAIQQDAQAGYYDLNLELTRVQNADAGFEQLTELPIFIGNASTNYAPVAVDSLTNADLLIDTLPNAPSAPNPADTSTDIDLGTALAWEGGDADSGDTVSYEVYLDTVNPPVTVADTVQFDASQTSVSFTPSTLQPDTDYYWKVVATDSFGRVTEGNVWMFTTGAEPTVTPTPTDSPIPTHTYTPLPTVTPAPTNTVPPTLTPEPTATPTNTPTPTDTPFPTETPTPSPTPTCAPCGHTPGITLNVPGDYPTILLALENACAGDTIQIAPGVYNEQLVLKNHDFNGDYKWDDTCDRDFSNVVIRGDSPSTTIIDAGGLVRDGNANRAIVVTTDYLYEDLYGYWYGQGNPNAMPWLDSVVIENIGIRNAGAGVWVGANVNNLTLRNVAFDNVFAGVFGTAQGVQNVSINNTSFLNIEYGVFASEARWNGLIVDRCTFDRDTDYAGILGTGAAVHGFEADTYAMDPAYGLGTSRSWTVSDNSVINLSRAFELQGIMDVSILTNTIEDPYTAMYIGTGSGSGTEGASENIRIEQNTFTNYAYRGVWLDGAKSVVLTNNILQGDNTSPQTLTGIYIEDHPSGMVSDDVQITHNDFKGTYNSGVRVTDASINIEVHNNNFFENGNYGVRNDATDPVDATWNWWGHSSGPSGFGPGNGKAVTTNVLYDPWVAPFTATGLDDITLTTAESSLCGSLTIEAYISDQLNMGTFAGRLTCSGGSLNYVDGGDTVDPLGVMLKITASPVAEMPAFQDGDYLTLHATGQQPFRVYLPSNFNTVFQDSLMLYVEGDGSTIFVNPAGNRNVASVGRYYIVARNAGDFASQTGSNAINLISTVSSDFNFMSMTHGNSDLLWASELFDLLQAQSGNNNIVRTVSMWNALGQNFTQYSEVPFPTGDFPLRPSMAVRIEINDTSFELLLEGAQQTPDSLSFNLVSTIGGSDYTWLGAPWYRGDLTFASHLAQDIVNQATAVDAGMTVEVASIAKWVPVSQTFVQYLTFPPVGNFTIQPGEAIRVEVNTRATYKPDKP